MFQYFFLQKPSPKQSEYLRRILEWARFSTQGLEAHWDVIETLGKAGRLSLYGPLQQNAEGIYNMLNGAILLSPERLPLRDAQCDWALAHWEHPLALSGRVDTLAVIVHETGHALAARRQGWWSAHAEDFPYSQEVLFLQQLQHLDCARSRLEDLHRDRGS